MRKHTVMSEATPDQAADTPTTPTTHTAPCTPARLKALWVNDKLQSGGELRRQEPWESEFNLVCPDERG